jgi:hypothetical protein
MMLREIIETQWIDKALTPYLQVVLILPAGESANNKHSVISCNFHGMGLFRRAT